jgi:hypothetical protein
VARFRDDAETALAAIRDHARSLAELADAPPDAAGLRARLLSALETAFGVGARPGSFEEIGIAVPHMARATAS